MKKQKKNVVRIHHINEEERIEAEWDALRKYCDENCGSIEDTF